MLLVCAVLVVVCIGAKAACPSPISQIIECRNGEGACDGGAFIPDFKDACDKSVCPSDPDACCIVNFCNEAVTKNGVFKADLCAALYFDKEGNLIEACSKVKKLEGPTNPIKKGLSCKDGKQRTCKRQANACFERVCLQRTIVKDCQLNTCKEALFDGKPIDADPCSAVFTYNDKLVKDCLNLPRAYGKKSGPVCPGQFPVYACPKDACKTPCPGHPNAQCVQKYCDKFLFNGKVLDVEDCSAVWYNPATMKLIRKCIKPKPGARIPKVLWGPSAVVIS